MVDRNPSSRWDEDTVIHGLTLFDINREPRKLSDKTISVTVESDIIDSLLTDNLKCGVCLGPLDSTLTTSCLHRFCSECLQRALRMDLGPKMHHECPSCRAKLASRRACKPDSKFDKLVDLFTGLKRSFDEMNGPPSENSVKGGSSDGKWSPRGTGSPRADETVDLKKYRDLHDQNIIKFRDLRAQKLLASANRGGNRNGSTVANSRKTMNANYLDMQQSIKRNGVSNATVVAKSPATAQNKVWLKLDPVPEWQPEPALRKLGHAESATAEQSARFELAHPFLRVPQYKSVSALKAYLLQRLSLAADQVAVDICGMFKNKMTVLDEALTVLDMTTKAWDAHSELVLYFRLRLK